MVKIRLTRTGKKGEPHYRIVAIQSKEKRESRAIEYLGFYNPLTKPSTFQVDKKRVEYWLSVGAQPTETVARFLAKEGLYKVPAKKFASKHGRKATDRAAKKAEASKQESQKASEETKTE